MIKLGIGKISFDETWESIVRKEIEQNALQILQISLDHTYRLEQLPPVHKDPFDRMLIAQAICEKMPILTDDGFIRSYAEVETVW